MCPEGIHHFLRKAAGEKASAGGGGIIPVFYTVFWRDAL